PLPRSRRGRGAGGRAGVGAPPPWGGVCGGEGDLPPRGGASGSLRTRRRPGGGGGGGPAPLPRNAGSRHAPPLRRSRDPAGRRAGLAAYELGVWRAMQALRDEGRVRLLGVSNVALDQLAAICEASDRPPAFVQNRCYACSGWDGEVRAFCRARGIVYQGFSL